MIARNQILRTYRQLRIMAGATLILIPLAIVISGWYEDQVVQPTLSHYYFFECNPGYIRTMFTGFLILVGGIMIAYRGFDETDNQIHNFAGISAICVAAFPKLRSKDCSDRFYTEGFHSMLHGPAAVILFCLAAYAVWYAGGKTLQSNLNASEKRTLKASKWISLITMLAGIIVYIWFLVFGKVLGLPNLGVLLVELFGFFGFAAHWIVMTLVISRANSRRAAGQEEQSRSAFGTSETAKQPVDSLQENFIP